MSLVLRTAAAASFAAIVYTAASATETVTYTYDAQGRLIQVTSTGVPNSTAQTSYEHDNADNRQRVVVTGSPNPPPS